MTTNGQGKKVLVVPLLPGKRLFTHGQTQTVEIDVGSLEKMGPMIEKMRVHFDGADYSANFQARFLFRWSVAGRIWSSDVEILANQTSEGQVIGSWYTNDTTLGLNMKYFLEYSNTTGTAAEWGRVAAWLEVVLKS